MGKQVFGKPVVGQPVFGKPVFGQPVFLGSYANISWKTNTCFPNLGHSLANTANHWPTTGQQSASPTHPPSQPPTPPPWTEDGPWIEDGPWTMDRPCTMDGLPDWPG